MKKIPLHFRIIISAILCLVFPVLLCSSISDKFSIQANTIRSIETKNNLSVLSAYVKEDYELSNYYNANAFYKIQQISSYWNYEAKQTNTAFFRYRQKNEIDIFSLEIDSKTNIPSTLIVPLSKNPIDRFKFKLLAGSEKKKIDEDCFDTIYISESIADKLVSFFGLTEENRVDNYNELLKMDDVMCRFNKILSGNNHDSTLKTTSIAGVIDSKSLGVMRDFFGTDFVCCSWTANLQLKINCPELILLFFKDRIKNEIYLKELSFLDLEGSKWHYHFSDINGEFVSGKVDYKIRNIKNSNVVVSIIFTIILLPCLPVLFYSFRKEKPTLKLSIFCGGFFLHLLVIILIYHSIFSIYISINMYNSFLLLFQPLLTGAILYYGIDSDHMEITI